MNTDAITSVTMVFNFGSGWTTYDLTGTHAEIVQEANNARAQGAHVRIYIQDTGIKLADWEPFQ